MWTISQIPASVRRSDGTPVGPGSGRRTRIRPPVVATCAAVAVLVGIAGACVPSNGAGATVRTIIDDLVAQEFARATARYEQQEDEVLAPAAAPAWRAGLDHGDPTVREWSADALSRIGEPEDVPRLVELLGDPFRNVREAAAEGLVRMAPDAARQELLERLASDASEQVTLAAGTLAAMEAEGVAGPMVARLQDRSLPAAVRGTLTTALARLGDPAAAEPLADLAVDPGADTQLRRLAAEALLALEGAGVGEQIERLLNADDEYVRELGAEALGR